MSALKAKFRKNEWQRLWLRTFLHAIFRKKMGIAKAYEYTHNNIHYQWMQNFHPEIVKEFNEVIGKPRDYRP